MQAGHQLFGDADLGAELGEGLFGHRDRLGEDQVEEGQRQPAGGDGSAHVGQRESGLLERLEQPNALDVARPVRGVLSFPYPDEPQLRHLPDALRSDAGAHGKFGFGKPSHG